MHTYKSSILKDYCQQLRKFVLLAGRNTPNEVEEASKYKLPFEDALERYDYRYGEDLYDFQLERPNAEILDAFKDEMPFDVDYTLSIEERLLNDISTSKCVLRIMNDGNLLIYRNRRKITVGYYQRQSELDECITLALMSSVIDWENAKIFFHPMHNYMYISDSFEQGILTSCLDDDIWMPSVPFSKDITSAELLSVGRQAIIDCLNADYKPRYFKNGLYILNQLEPNVVYPKANDGLSIGSVDYYIDILKNSDLLDIDEDDKTFLVKNVYNSHHKKPKSKRHYVVNRFNGRNVSSSSLNLPRDFVGIDFETLYSQRVSACSVGMVKYKDGKIVDRYYSLIRPPFNYPGKCGKALTWIHGFTEDQLANERTFDKVLPEMEAFAEGLPLVAHNACVERSCIFEASAFYGLSTSLDYMNIIDTLPISRTVERIMGIYVEGPGTHKLDAVCRRFNVSELHHHNALDDAEMCGNLLSCFKKIIDENVDLDIDVAKVSNTTYEKYKPEDKVQRTDLENVVENPFKDCGVVLTGFSASISQEYAHKLKELGAKVCTGVSGKTKWLICGANAGPSKLEKAQSIGANIINEDEFLKLINDIK